MGAIFKLLWSHCFVHPVLIFRIVEFRVVVYSAHFCEFMYHALSWSLFIMFIGYDNLP